ncbi:3'-5' exonuclease [Caminibacter sp.]
MELTYEQQQILKAVKSNLPLIKINAFAGTGKTTTLIEIAKANPGKRILYLAFNKAIQEEARAKFPKNVEVKTTHSLAYRYIIPKAGYNVRNNYKAPELMELLNLDYESAVNVLNYFEFYCNSAIANISSLGIGKEILINIETLFNSMLNGSIDVTHSFYLKVFQLYLKKKMINIYSYDMVLLDEAQDTNDVTIDIFYSIPARQKIIVGDRHQQIYSFRGSINAMDKIKGEEYYLTHSFRFNEEIAAKASRVLNIFKAEEQQLKGLGKNKEIKNKAYISRTNAALIEVMNELMKEDKKFKTVRNPYEIFALSLNVYNLSKGRELDKNFRYLSNLIDEETDEEDILSTLAEKAEEVEDVELLSAVKIVERFKNRLFDIYKKAKEYFYENFECKIFLTTAHTSKGLEWDEVELTNDFPAFYTIAKWWVENGLPIKRTDFVKIFTDAQKEKKVNQKFIDEFNLYYVAITRAKTKLIDKTDLADIKSKREANEEVYFILKNLN